MPIFECSNCGCEFGHDAPFRLIRGDKQAQEKYKELVDNH